MSAGRGEERKQQSEEEPYLSRVRLEGHAEARVSK